MNTIVATGQATGDGSVILAKNRDREVIEAQVPKYFRQTPVMKTLSLNIITCLNHRSGK